MSFFGLYCQVWHSDSACGNIIPSCSFFWFLFLSNKRCDTVTQEVGWFNSKEGGACDNIISASLIFWFLLQQKVWLWWHRWQQCSDEVAWIESAQRREELVTILFQLLLFSCILGGMDWIGSKKGGACENVIPASSIFWFLVQQKVWHSEWRGGLVQFKGGRSLWQYYSSSFHFLVF